MIYLLFFHMVLCQQPVVHKGDSPVPICHFQHIQTCSEKDTTAIALFTVFSRIWFFNHMETKYVALFTNLPAQKKKSVKLLDLGHLQL